MGMRENGGYDTSLIPDPSPGGRGEIRAHICVDTPLCDKY